MKAIKFQPTTKIQDLRDLLSNAINESIALDNIKESDIISKGKTFSNDGSEDLVIAIEIPNIYPSDSREHLKKNTENFDRIVKDFTSFLIGEIPASYPLLLFSPDEQETLLVNLSDYHIHIYYHYTGQY